jgi:hypothetical protein
MADGKSACYSTRLLLSQRIHRSHQELLMGLLDVLTAAIELVDCSAKAAAVNQLKSQQQPTRITHQTH